MIAPNPLGHCHRRQPIKQILLESGLQLGADRHIPAALRRKGPTFYRVLLGHQHRHVFGEIQILWLENVMIGKRMLQGAQSGAAQMIEKPPRIANPGHGVNRAVAKPGQRGADIGISQIHRLVAVQAH